MAIRITTALILVCVLSYEATCKSLKPCEDAIKIGTHHYTTKKIENDYVVQLVFDNGGNMFYINVELDNYNETDKYNEEDLFGKLYILRQGSHDAEYIKLEDEAEALSIALDKTGRLLVNTDMGVYIYDVFTNQIIPYIVDTDAIIMEMTVGPDGTIFVLLVDDNKVYTIERNKLVPYQNLTSQFLVKVDAKNNLYINNENSTYVVQKNYKYALEVFKNNALYDIAFDSDNNVYGVNDKGFWFSYEGTDSFEKIFDVEAYALAVDKDGSIVVVSSEIIFKFSRVTASTC